MPGINTKQLKEYIIEPTLKAIDLHSESAVNLLLGTCAQESSMGYYLHQISGPALGIYQIEPASYHDLVSHYVKSKPKIWSKAVHFASTSVCFIKQEELLGNLFFATVICRLFYYRVPKKLPEPDDTLGLAKYWKKYYNTEKGRGTVSGFIGNYSKFEIDKL